LKDQEQDEQDIKINIRGTGCEDGGWMELFQDCAQWRALLLAV
jgi:hypothetical protein